MTRIGDRAFMHAWQIIRAATQPSPEATEWEVAGVRWRRYRLSHAAPAYAATMDVHRLDHGKGREAWSVLVVIEHWWDERHRLLRDQSWAVHVCGPRPQIAEWIACQSRAGPIREAAVSLNRLG